MSKLLTTREAAERLEMPLRSLQTLIKEGLVRAERHGPIYLIREKDLAKVVRRPVGRPKKETKK